MKTLLAIVALAGATHADPLVVTAKPATLAWHVGQPVDVALRVVNASATVQTFQAMSCSWQEHWKADDDTLVTAGWACKKNGLQKVELGPGKAYEKTLAIHATAPGRRMLRLSFTPHDGAPIWSVPVAITVER